MDSNSASDCNALDSAREPTHNSTPCLIEAFEAWADRQTFTTAEAGHVAHIINYLIMDEREPLPAPLRANLARHVAAVSNGRL